MTRRSVDRREILRALGGVGTAVVAGCQTPATTDTSDEGDGEATPTDEGGCEEAPTGDPAVRVPRTRVGEPLPISLSGFEPDEQVTLHVETTDDAYRTFSRQQTERTDECGTVETVAGTGTDESFVGFDGPDAPRMPISQLAREDIEVDSARNAFETQDPSPIELTLQARVDGETRTSTTVNRVLEDPGVTRHRVDDPDLVGWFYEPASEGPHPGVVTLHGSRALVTHEYSKLLASHGYATLALQYFGAGGLPSTLAEVPIEYFDRAIEWLLDRPAVTDGRVGTLGVSRGVEAAVLAAASFEGAAVAVGYVGSGSIVRGQDGSGASAWTRNGDPIVSGEQYERLDEITRDLRWRRCRSNPCDPADSSPTEACESVACYYDTLQEIDSDVLDAISVPVEDVDGPVLLLSGTADEVWDSSTYSEWAIRRLEQQDHEHPYAHYAFEGAGHGFGLPYLDYPRGSGDDLEANARAAVRSWPLVLDALELGLG